MSQKIKIMASSKEEWDKLHEVIEALPLQIKNQIEWAEKGTIHPTFHLKKLFTDNPKIYAPKHETNRIYKWHDEVCILCSNYEMVINNEITYEYDFI